MSTEPGFFQFSHEQVRDYHASPSNQLDEVQALIEARFFAGALSILDLGCGDGKKTAWLAKQLATSTVVGCDVSASMVAFASREYSSQEYPNLQFVEKDARDLGFSDRFDRIISFNCLHWIKDQKLALQKIHAALKPGGKALLVVSPKSSQDDLQKACRQVIFSWKWLPRFLLFKSVHSFHSEKEYSQLLQGTQFSIEKIARERKQVQFQNREVLESLLKAILTPLYHLPEKRRAEFLDDLFTQLAKNGNVKKSGEIHLHFDQLRIFCIKKGPKTHV